MLEYYQLTDDSIARLTDQAERANRDTMDYYQLTDDSITRLTDRANRVSRDTREYYQLTDDRTSRLLLILESEVDTYYRRIVIFCESSDSHLNSVAVLRVQQYR